MALRTLNGINENDLLEFLNKELIIYEDIQGSKIWVNYNKNTGFKIKPKSLKNDNINLVDLAMQKYYNNAILYLESLPKSVKSLLNNKWWFCFEYFPDKQPANIEYDRLPLNGLVLTTIFKGSKYTNDIDEINEYASLFNVDRLPIIFSGKLNDEVKTAMNYFLNTSEEDLEYVFGEKSFTFFFYKLLNPNKNNSFLMDSDFHSNIEKIIITSKDNSASFQILNPLYNKISYSNDTDFTEIYSMFILNFLSFCQNIDLKSIKIKGQKRDQMYLYLMCKLFNLYMAESKEDILSFDFIIPTLFDKEKFKINTLLIDDKTTKMLVEENPKIEYVFKIILGSFNKKKSKPIGLFTDNTLKLFNEYVERIRIILDIKIGYTSEIELKKRGLVNFGDFFHIKYDTDGEGKVYPDVYIELEKSLDAKNKKSKK